MKSKNGWQNGWTINKRALQSICTQNCRMPYPDKLKKDPDYTQDIKKIIATYRKKALR